MSGITSLFDSLSDRIRGVHDFAIKASELHMATDRAQTQWLEMHSRAIIRLTIACLANTAALVALLIVMVVTR